MRATIGLFMVLSITTPKTRKGHCSKENNTRPPLPKTDEEVQIVIKRDSYRPISHLLQQEIGFDEGTSIVSLNM